MSELQLDKLLKDNPQFHGGSDGPKTSFAVAPDVLRYLAGVLEPGMVTLETGAGHTTIVFAMAGTRHFCITPSRAESERIRQYCAAIGLQPDITFLNESSDTALQKADVLPDAFDCVFIDGAHRFPLPCVDYHYAGDKVRIGGILGVDDRTLPSVEMLYDFLCVDADWQLTKNITNTAFFTRVNRTVYNGDGWPEQRINYRMAKRINGRKRGPLTRACGMVFRLLRKTARLIEPYA
jgi:predicted O-methyltransferase YrrM